MIDCQKRRGKEILSGFLCVDEHSWLIRSLIFQLSSARLSWRVHKMTRYFFFSNIWICVACVTAPNNTLAGSQLCITHTNVCRTRSIHFCRSSKSLEPSQDKRNSPFNPWIGTDNKSRKKTFLRILWINGYWLIVCLYLRQSFTTLQRPNTQTALGSASRINQWSTFTISPTRSRSQMANSSIAAIILVEFVRRSYLSRLRWCNRGINCFALQNIEWLSAETELFVAFRPTNKCAGKRALEFPDIRGAAQFKQW